MRRYSSEPRDRIVVKGYGYSSFAKNIDKNISENLINKTRNFLIIPNILK